MLKKQNPKLPRGLCVRGREGTAEKQDLCARKAAGIKEPVRLCVCVSVCMRMNAQGPPGSQPTPPVLTPPPRPESFVLLCAKDPGVGEEGPCGPKPHSTLARSTRPSSRF